MRNRHTIFHSDFNYLQSHHEHTKVGLYIFIYILTNACYLLYFWWCSFWQVWGPISLWMWFVSPWRLLTSIFSFVCSLSSYVLLKMSNQAFLEKEMATHSSTLAWKIPWTEEPCRLQSMGSQTVGHDWATSLSTQYSFRPSNHFFDWLLVFWHWVVCVLCILTTYWICHLRISYPIQ